jgi:hypothetical protein
VARAFVGSQVGHAGKLKSLDNLEPAVLDGLNHTLSKQSNDQLEAQFLEFVKGKTHDQTSQKLRLPA